MGIHELKTRSKPSLPPPAQQRCTHLQLMLYKMLWDKLVLEGICCDDLERVLYYICYVYIYYIQIFLFFEDALGQIGAREHLLR